MRIAIAQLSTLACDFENTVDRMAMLSSRASSQGAELVLFSFAALTGALPVDYVNYDGYALDVWDAFASLASKVACPCLVPFINGSGMDALSDAALVHDGVVETVGQLAFGDVVGREPSRGESQETYDGTFSFGGIRWGIGFTYEDIDRMIDDAARPDVLVFSSAYGFALDDPSSAMGASLLENRFRVDATTLDAWIVGIGSVGAYGDRVFAGSSFVLAPSGELAASAPAFEEALVMCDIDPSFAGRLSEPEEPELYNRPLHLWEALAIGLRGYVWQLGCSDVALVLDGGLNSSLLAALSTDAVGPTHVHALLSTSDATCLDRARKLCEALRIGVLDDTLPGAGVHDGGLGSVALAQTSLLGSARELNAVVVGAQDKTFLALEVAVGQYHSAEVLPFGDVYRSDVIEMAHMRNTISPIIPAACFSSFAVPDIEGLGEVEQSPEARLRRVDVTLATHIEWGRSVTDTIARQGAPEVTERVLRRMREVQPARMAWPPPLVVSSRTLFDARLPLGMPWMDRPRSTDDRLRMIEAGRTLHGLSEGAEAPQVSAAEVERMSQELSELFGGIGSMSTALVGGVLPDGVDRATVERSVEDLLGLLQDIMQSGGLPNEDGSGMDGPFGPLTWGGPFSEN